MRQSLLVLLALSMGGLLSAQRRDASPASPSGTGVISGTVIVRDAGTPVKSARVALTGPALEEAKLVMAGDDGVFRFEGLAAGEYRIWAVRAGFLTSSYGEKKAG